MLSKNAPHASSAPLRGTSLASLRLLALALGLIAPAAALAADLPSRTAPPPPPAPVLDPAALARSARPLVERFRDAWTAGDFLTVLNVLGDGGGMGSAALAPIAGDVQRWRRERPGQSLEITGLALVNSDDPASPRMVATLSTPDGAGMRLSLRQVNGLWRATGLVKIGGAASP